MKKTLRRFAPVALVLLGLTVLSFTTAAGIKLMLKPQQGKTYTVTQKANSISVMKVQGQSMNMSQNMDITQTFTPKEVNDSQSVIETQVEAIKMSVSQMGMKFEYDSEHPEKTSPLIAGQTQEFEKNLKKPATLTFDSHGKLTSEKQDLGMSQLGHVIIELPDEELVVGSKWNHLNEQEISGTSFTVNMEYTVTAISKKSVDLSFSGNIDSKDVSGTYNGTASIDPQTGLMVRNTTKSNISMTINEQGLTIPMTVDATATIEVK